MPQLPLPLVRAVLTIINKHDLKAVQLDVKTAILNSNLTEEMYMWIPEGIKYGEITKRTNRLQKTLYDLRINLKKWNKKFSETVLKLGLKKDFHESCLFTRRRGNKLVNFFCM